MIVIEGKLTHVRFPSWCNVIVIFLKGNLTPSLCNVVVEISLVLVLEGKITRVIFPASCNVFDGNVVVPIGKLI